MNIDPIVLLAYVSVALNIITMLAACIAYAIFHVRKRRRKKDVHVTPGRPDGPVTPVFLRRHTMAWAHSTPGTGEAKTDSSVVNHASALAEIR